MKRLELYYSCNNKSIHHAQIRKMHNTVPYFKIFRHCQQSQQFTSNKRKEKRMQYNDIPLIGRQLFVYSHGPELQACMTALISHSAKTQPGEKEKKISSMQIRAHNLRSLAGPTSYQKKKIKKSQAFISKSCCHRFSILTQDRQSYPWISLQLLKKPYPHSGCHKRK